MVNEIKVIINDNIFIADLVDNQATREFVNMLPLSLEMKDLNGNEKYYYFTTILTMDFYAVEDIKCGDIMLYSSDCLALFYDDFSKENNYTRIGKIRDINRLKEALGTGSVVVNFEK